MVGPDLLGLVRIDTTTQFTPRMTIFEANGCCDGALMDLNLPGAVFFFAPHELRRHLLRLAFGLKDSCSQSENANDFGDPLLRISLSM